MTFDQDMLDAFLELIRCDVEYTLKEFNDIIRSLCISNFDMTPTTLFENATEIEFQATPTKHGFLKIETKNKDLIIFDVAYNDSGLTSIKIGRYVHGKK